MATLFAERVSENRERECLVSGSRRLTYGDVDEQATALAAALHDLGVESGGRIAVEIGRAHV